MKTIGILGGMSWESSIEYERLINQAVRKALGGTNAADLIIRSYNFAEIEAFQEAGDWDAVADVLATDASALESAGADCILIATNTMHRVAHAIEERVNIPLLHIADATGAAIDGAGIGTVALLGTRYTMEQDFYRSRLEVRGLTVLIPPEPDRTAIHDVIYTELVRGIVREESRKRYLEVIDRLVDRGAEGVIAGCTEIELLVRAVDVAVPYFPTTELHARAAADFALRSS